MSFWDNLLHTVTDFIQDTAATVTDFIQDPAATVTDVIQDPGALTDVIQDTAAALTDFLESAGITYGNYGGLNYSAGVEGGTITETSPPPINAYDAAFYLHDLAHQSSSDPAVRLPADIQ